jgi:uncharacterized protein YndB with AHSA1/START domain
MNEAHLVTIAPVRKILQLRATQAHAFEVFTAGLDRWWPKSHHIGATEPKRVMIEPRLGGRWLEQAADGTETVVGHILIWEPPQRFVVSWEINGEWQPDPQRGSELELRFIAEGAETTRVELEHRLFERMGPEGGTKMRDAVERGWPAILELFRQVATKT